MPCHSVTESLLLHFIQCSFPNQIQFGLEKLHPKIAYDFPNLFQFGLERKIGILQDTDSKPNSGWLGKFWWPSWKFQTKFSLVGKNHWLLSMPWALNQFQFYFVKSYFRKGKHSNIHICLNLSFTCQYCQGSRAEKMDSEILLRLLPKEYEYKINNIKILGRWNWNMPNMRSVFASREANVGLV